MYSSAKGRRNKEKTEKVTELTAQVKRFKSAEGQMIWREKRYSLFHTIVSLLSCFI